MSSTEEIRTSSGSDPPSARFAERSTRRKMEAVTSHLSLSEGAESFAKDASDLHCRGEGATPMKRLMAGLGVGLVVVGVLAAAVVEWSSLPGLAAPETEGGRTLRAPSEGMGEPESATAAPSYAYTL